MSTFPILAIIVLFGRTHTVEILSTTAGIQPAAAAAPPSTTSQGAGAPDNAAAAAASNTRLGRVQCFQQAEQSRGFANTAKLDAKGLHLDEQIL